MTFVAPQNFLSLCDQVSKNETTGEFVANLNSDILICDDRQALPVAIVYEAMFQCATRSAQILLSTSGGEKFVPSSFEGLTVKDVFAEPATIVAKPEKIWDRFARFRCLVVQRDQIVAEGIVIVAEFISGKTNV